MSNFIDVDFELRESSTQRRWQVQIGPRRNKAKFEYLLLVKIPSICSHRFSCHGNVSRREELLHTAPRKVRKVEDDRFLPSLLVDHGLSKGGTLRSICGTRISEVGIIEAVCPQGRAGAHLRGEGANLKRE